MVPYHSVVTEIRRVLVIEPFEGARWRSITAYSSSLQEMLRAAGIEVEVASAPWFNPPSMTRAIRSRWWNQQAIQDAAAGKFDMVHLTDHALGHHAGRFAAHTPTLVTCHDLMPFTLPGYYASTVEAVVKRAFLRRPYGSLKDANVVIAVSEYTAADLARRLNLAESVVAVPNVVRPAFHPAPRSAAEDGLARAGIQLRGGVRILSVGNDRAYKNLRPLIEALAHPLLAHATLVRVGPPLHSSLARRAEELGVLRRIQYVRAETDELLALAYGAASVLAQPSLAEGFGIPVVEAMACGLPVVVSDGGALPEVAGGAGVVVPLSGADFPSRFAHGLDEAMRDADALARAGLARAKAFEPGAVLPRMFEAYSRAKARRASG